MGRDFIAEEKKERTPNTKAAIIFSFDELLKNYEASEGKHKSEFNDFDWIRVSLRLKNQEWENGFLPKVSFLDVRLTVSAMLSLMRAALTSSSTTGTAFLKPSERPPKLADSIICLFLPKDQALVLLGDLIEDYKPLRKNRGDFVANVWYWRQALSATRPALQRWGIKIATLCGFEEVVRRFLH